MGRVITYKELSDKISRESPPENKLLQLSKFCSVWDQNSFRMSETGKNSFIAEFSGFRSQKTGEVAAAYLNKYKVLEAGLPSAHLFTLKTISGMAIGLGGQNPLENSLTLHHLYGFPIIPGSTVKGVARAYAELSGECSKSELKQIFGSDDKENPDKSIRGLISFYDAIPASEYKFTADILTPHYQAYYSDDSKSIFPGDYMSPVPVPFICLDKGVEFAFLVQAADRVLLERALTFLKGGLTNIGVGAKTNIGYGFFAGDTAISVVITEQQGKKPTSEEYIK